MKDRITIEGRDGAFGAYIARPKTLPAPAVVVLQEVFGVNADIRKTCDELAEQGFIAVAPDLFWRQEPGVDLSVTSEADWQHGLRLSGPMTGTPAPRTSRTPSTPWQAAGMQRQGCRPRLLPRRTDGLSDSRALTGSMLRSPITAVTPRNIWVRSMGLMRPS